MEPKASEPIVFDHCKASKRLYTSKEHDTDVGLAIILGFCLGALAMYVGISLW